MYKDYAKAYLDIMDNDPNTNSHLDIRGLSNYPENQQKELLRKRKDMFRRYRDLSIFAFIGVYLISVIDAYVDAELSNFDHHSGSEYACRTSYYQRPISLKK